VAGRARDTGLALDDAGDQGPPEPPPPPPPAVLTAGDPDDGDRVKGFSTRVPFVVSKKGWDRVRSSSAYSGRTKDASAGSTTTSGMTGA
jgi:hypothetical protein